MLCFIECRRSVDDCGRCAKWKIRNVLHIEKALAKDGCVGNCALVAVRLASQAHAPGHEGHGGRPSKQSPAFLTLATRFLVLCVWKRNRQKTSEALIAGNKNPENVFGGPRKVTVYVCKVTVVTGNNGKLFIKNAF